MKKRDKNLFSKIPLSVKVIGKIVNDKFYNILETPTDEAEAVVKND